MKPILKFRPSLTSTMLEEIYVSLPEGETKSYIHQFIVKINSGITKPGYVNTGLNTIESSLGFPILDSGDSGDSNSNIDKRKLKYNLWLQNPSLLNKNDLELVETYRYENDLLSPEETIQYENKLFGKL